MSNLVARAAVGSDWWLLWTRIRSIDLLVRRCLQHYLPCSATLWTSRGLKILSLRRLSVSRSITLLSKTPPLPIAGVWTTSAGSPTWGTVPARPAGVRVCVAGFSLQSILKSLFSYIPPARTRVPLLRLDM